MARRWTRFAGVLLVLALAGHPSRCVAQEPPPVRGPSAADAPLPGSPLGDGSPLSVGRGPFGAPASAWFAGLEVGLFVPFPPVGTGVTGKNVTLQPGVEPSVQLGYRFEDGSALRVTYRNLSSSSRRESVSPDGGTVPPHLRLEVNALDLDYVSQEIPGLFCDRVAWEAGVRLASKLLDSRGSGFYNEQSSHSLFTGAGPHLGLTDSLRLGGSGFGVFSRVELALLFGDTQDRLESTPVPGYGGYSGGPSAPYRYSSAGALADAGAQLGVYWAGTIGERFWVRAAFGVEAEFVGFGQAQLIDFGNSTTRLRDGLGGAGPFFRCEIAY